MHADLVGASCMQHQLHSRHMRCRGLQQAVIRDRVLALRCHGHPLAIHGMAPHGLLDPPVRRAWDAEDDGLIRTVDRMDAQLSGKSHVRAVILRNHQQAADILVETMDDARPLHPADPRQATGAMGQQGMHQGTAGMAGSRMDNDTGRLVQHEQMFILVADIQRPGLGDEGHGHRSGKIDLKPLGTFDPSAGLGYHRTVDTGMTAPDQLLDARTRMVVELSGQESVDPLAGCAGLDLE